MFRNLLVWLLPCLAFNVSAKDPVDFCGTWVGRAQQESFLHKRHVVERARVAALSGARALATPFAQDFGNIAVMDDSGGVIGRRNPFNLDRQTVSFTPNSGGYKVELAGDTFDSQVLTQNTATLALTDDDTTRITLPFPFRFFGTDYQQAYVNSNGTISFTKGDLDYTGTFGHFVAGPPAIAGVFTDLDPSSTGVLTRAEAGRVVVTWYRVPLADSAAFGNAQIETFQIRLYPSGKIELAYRGASPPNALVGITPGSFSRVELVDFAGAPAGTFTQGIAESFNAADAVDTLSAAQRFYQTHDDAYDYLVFYNAAGVAADAGVVAYEMTTRSNGEGYGDTPVDFGAEFGSKKRLQAVLNMGPLAQYPLSPNGTVLSRQPIGDTPLTLLGHEAGHLFLALVSITDPANPASLPMLGAAMAHWSFPFNSEASFLGGERIMDRGADVRPRFQTTATVEGYAPLDQYLMGFRSPEEVPTTFVVLNSGNALTRTPQVGVSFQGTRLDVTADDIAKRHGRRTPDSTVAQRHFRFGFVLIVPAGSQVTASTVLSAGVAQVEQYRQQFEAFYLKATSGRASADTALRRGVNLSLAPSAGILEGAEVTASIELSTPTASPLTFTLRKANGVLLSPTFVTIPAGASRATFSVFGGREGVEEFTAEPSDASYESAFARVQVSRTSRLHLSLVSSSPLVVRVEDQNKLAYAGVRVNGMLSAADGTIPFPIVNSPLSIAIDGVTAAPRITKVVNGASFESRIAPGSFVSIFGGNLGTVRLTINDAVITPQFVSASQVNFVAPGNLSPGPVRFVIETAFGVTVADAVLQMIAPAIFYDALTGRGAVQLVIPGSGQVIPDPGAILVVYCTGLKIGGFLDLLLDGKSSTGPLGRKVELRSPGLFVASFLILGIGPGPDLRAGEHTAAVVLDGVVSNTVKFTLDPGN